MATSHRFSGVAWVAIALLASSFTAAHTGVAGEPWRPFQSEQQCLSIRAPGHLNQVAAPTTPPPATVSDPQLDIPSKYVSLDDAIRTTLANSEVVRVLGGVTASSSGRSIYDTAITNTTIDQQRAQFDPNLRLNNTWNQTETPSSAFDPLNPLNAVIGGNQNEGYALDFGLTQRNLTGGTASLGVNANSNRINPGPTPLNPTDRTATELSYTQPLLQGAGRDVNRVPIVLARIDTERSYFQYKNAVQQSVQGVIEAYWSLVFARTDLWTRQKQVEQAEFAFERTKSRVEVGDANEGDLAQTQVALENFRASLLASQANVLQRQAALLNIMGLPPYESERAIPVTPMLDRRVEIQWDKINQLAARMRPDIIELKLILEADQQQLILADNEARPRLDGVALYRWNGIEGIAPAGNRVQSGNGQFDDWSLGVNFSVPIGLRRERALLRQRQLLITRDRANLDQGLHQMQHLLALNVRNIDQFFSQYERFQSVRKAARKNLEQQLAQYKEGIVQFIVVLQAIVDWGSAVSSEAQALSQYNSELARLEFQTGTILESHGVYFFEERFCAIGPLGRLAGKRAYPRSQPPGTKGQRYDTGRTEGDFKPSEEYFDLEDPVESEATSEDQETKLVPLDMDTEIDFPGSKPKGNEEIPDEEIDRILEGKNASSRFRGFFKRFAKLRK